MLVTSQSSEGNDFDENIPESEEIGYMLYVDQSSQAQTNSANAN